jgi:hypothetical protein
MDELSRRLWVREREVFAQARPAHFVQRRPYSDKHATQQRAAVDITITIGPVLGGWLQHEWPTGGDIGTPYTLSKAVSWRGLTLSHPHTTHVHMLLFHECGGQTREVRVQAKCLYSEEQHASQRWPANASAAGSGHTDDMPRHMTSCAALPYAMSAGQKK